MKILDCSEGERVFVDDGIVLTVVEVTEDEVCFKIELPEGAQVRLEDAHDYAT